MPSQLNITVALNVSGTLTNSVLVVPISAGLQALDSGNASGAGVASGQTGYSSVDEAIRNIARARCFFVPSTSTWYLTDVVQSISWS
jgi:hypothetical protein